MTSFLTFLEANTDVLTAGLLMLLVGTFAIGSVVFVVISLERSFDAADGEVR
jgi:hypothetical protein